MYDDENMTRLDGAETEDSDIDELVIDDEFMRMSAAVMMMTMS